MHDLQLGSTPVVPAADSCVWVSLSLFCLKVKKLCKLFSPGAVICMWFKFSQYSTITLENLDYKTFISGTQIHYTTVRVEFIYRGHRVKVKVTAVKSQKTRVHHMLNLIDLMWYAGLHFNGSQITAATGAVELAWDTMQFEVVCAVSLVGHHRDFYVWFSSWNAALNSWSKLVAWIILLRYHATS